MTAPDPLVRYRAKIKAEIKIRDLVYDMYRSFWPFLRRLPCSEKAALSSYKETSHILNSILWLPEEDEILRRGVTDHLSVSRVPVPFLREMTIEFLTKELRTITSLEQVFTKAPRLLNPMTVFRGVSKKYSGSYTGLKPGDRVTPKSFVSTSFNFDAALQFSKFGETGVVLRIRLPKGIQYVLLPGGGGSRFGETTTFTELMKDKAYARDEMELLLNKNTVFELVSVEKTAVAPSVDYTAKKYRKLQGIKIFTLKVISSEDKKFEMKAEEIVEVVKEVTFQITAPPAVTI